MDNAPARNGLTLRPPRSAWVAHAATDVGQNVRMAIDDTLRVYRTGFHDCGYFPDRFARDLLMDPRDPRMDALYPMALAWGFRRSGDMVYRPDCVACRACTAVRIPVDRFQPDRAQRRCLARNADLVVRVVPAERTDEQFALYHRYLQSRHAGGGMEDHVEVDFDRFLTSRFADTRFIEIRAPAEHATGPLLAVAVTDLLPDALSAVYTFFDPAQAARSLGTFAVLQQLAWARREHRDHLYLGYWIAGHPKMDYKRRYRPIERYDGGRWRELTEALELP